MRRTDFGSAVRALVNTALPYYDPHKALYLGIDARAEHPTARSAEYQENNRAGASLHLLIQKTSNYITVWSRRIDDILPRYNQVKYWGDNIVHHDSCWIYTIEQENTQLYFRTTEAAMIAEDEAPKDMIYTSNIWSSAIVSIETERVMRNRVDRRWIVTNKHYSEETNPDDNS